jgi:hypothetical protein
LSEKAFRKHNIDIKNPPTVDYNTILQSIAKSIESNQFIEDLEVARGASATVQGKTELVDIIGQIKPADSAREGRFIDPYCSSTTRS